MPLASVRDSGTAGLPVAREARRRGLKVSEMIADSLGNGTSEQVIDWCLWHDAADATEIGCIEGDTIPCRRCPVCRWVRSRCRCASARPRSD